MKKRVNGAWEDDSGYIASSTHVDYTSFPIAIEPTYTPLNVVISGNMTQTGTPTPEDPIQPQECGDKTGNLYQFPYTLNFSLSGSGNNRTVISTAYTRSNILKLKPNTTYYFTGQRAQATDNFGRIALFTDKPEVNSVSTHFYSFSNNGSTTFTTDATENYALVYLAQPEDYNIDYNMMLIEGSTALPYEPYGIKIPISSANTTTPVYLGEVQTTRRIKKLVLTGQENWVAASGTEERTVSYISITDAGDSVCLCSHIEYKSIYSASDINQILLRNLANRLYISIDVNIAADLSAFKTWLQQQYAAGTPVCVWYVLATETTGIVNEPIRKIGDYADEVFVKIPVTIGEDTIDISTTIKPSKFSVLSIDWISGNDYKRSDGAWT